jgi:hypothetical protein
MTNTPTAKDLIRYDLLVQEALKSVVRRVLIDAARDGLPGEHHFYISFRTDAPGVRLSQRMRDKYPEEMTIVLQHQFWDLGITEHAFEVGLSFSGVPERLLIPFDSVVGFFDPSVQFGLKFELQGDAAAAAEPGEPAPGTPEPETARPAAAPTRLPSRARQPAAEAGEGGAVAGKAEKPAAAPGRDGSKEVGKGAGKGAAKGAGTEPQEVSAEANDQAEAGEGGGAQVVSLDAFRKKT